MTGGGGGIRVGRSGRRHQRETGSSIRVRGDVSLDLDDVGKWDGYGVCTDARKKLQDGLVGSGKKGK